MLLLQDCEQPVHPGYKEKIMKTYIARKVVQVLASFMILIPGVLLLAWESKIPNVLMYWLILLICAVIFAVRLYIGEADRHEMNFKTFFSKCGGFCIMIGFIVFEIITLL